MTRPRFLVERLDDEEIVLGPEETHHLVHVLRLGAGAGVTVFDGRGRAREATVQSAGRESAVLAAGPELPGRESRLGVTVAMGVPKGDRMTSAVEKLTEIGVLAIQPLVTEHGDVPPAAAEARRERWRRVAVAAAKQCRRARLPEIAPVRTLGEALDGCDGPALVLVPGAPPLEPPPAPERGAGSLLVAVGPEGGWSAREIELATERAATAFGLGPRTLRTETAAVAAASLVQWLWGDWREPADRP